MPNSRAVAAFSEEHASKLSGVSIRQLRYWARTGFFAPAFADYDRRGAYSRVYSFSDIVALRVLHELRNQYKVPLQHLREVRAKLAQLRANQWSSIKLWVLNRRVVWREPKSQSHEEVLSRQLVAPVVLLGEIAADTRRDVAELNARGKAQVGQVTRSRFVNHNAPVIAGTRIPVKAIKRFADAGYTSRQILREYPDLTEKDIDAALAYELKHAA